MKKKKHDEHEVSEAWLLPYSDLMTLLLAVFIVLFAASKIDQAKAESMSSAFSDIFGISEASSDKLHIDSPDGQPDFDFNINPFPEMQPDNDEAASTEEASTEKAGTEEANKEEADKEEAKRKRMNDLVEVLRSYLAENDHIGEFSISNTPDMITITLNADILFLSGRAELNDNEKIIAKQLAGIIYNAQEKNFSFQVIVSGHTDTVPINSDRYASNWELSLDRASNFTFAMLADSQLDPRMFYSVGHGELDPVATNDTAKGRAKNRRVEIKLILQESVE